MSLVLRKKKGKKSDFSQVWWCRIIFKKKYILKKIGLMCERGKGKRGKGRFIIPHISREDNKYRLDID